MNIIKILGRCAGAVALAAVLCAPVLALEIRSVRTLDSLKAPRSSFSSNETITLACEVYSATDEGVVSFTYVITDPRGARVFRHSGNSIPGTVGAGGTELAHIPISGFFTTFGTFTLAVTAAPAAGAAVTRTTTFSVQSPAITLSYPPNGVQNIIDQPLIFRWMASGAARYRITVDDDPSFYNALFTETVQDTAFAYPVNPFDPRHRLAGGTRYYWKIEGLDAQGNRIAQSAVPFSFTLMSAGSQTASTRDIALTDVTLAGEDGLAGATFAVTVRNNGGLTESSIAMTLYIDGTERGSHMIDRIQSGEVRQVMFTAAAVPREPGRPLLVSASHSFFDDDVRNNIVTRSLAVVADDGASPSGLWALIRPVLSDAQRGALAGYVVRDVQGADEQERGALARQLRLKKARVVSAVIE